MKADLKVWMRTKSSNQRKNLNTVDQNKWIGWCGYEGRQWALAQQEIK